MGMPIPTVTRIYLSYLHAFKAFIMLYTTTFYTILYKFPYLRTKNVNMLKRIAHKCNVMRTSNKALEMNSRHGPTACVEPDAYRGTRKNSR